MKEDTFFQVVSPVKKTEIEISVNGSSYTLLHTWKKMMTVGRASDVLICDVQKMLTQIQETVGFEYIKLCGIFSDDLHTMKLQVKSRSIAFLILIRFWILLSSIT